MANTILNTGHPLAAKIWSKDVAYEMQKVSQYAQLMGTDPANVIVVKEDLTKNKGDNVYVPLVMIPTGDGVQGDNTLEGNEEALLLFRDTLVINQLRHAMKSDGKMSEQRDIVDFREAVRTQLGAWFAVMFDEGCANQAAGNTLQADTRHSGNNATIAASTTSGNSRIQFGDGTCTTANCLSVCLCYITLTMIDRLEYQAEAVATPRIMPAMTPLGRGYVFVMHSLQQFRLRTDNAANTVNWYTVQLAAIQGGGNTNDNPIIAPGFNGYLGKYNNTFLYADSRMPLTTASGVTNVRRAAFMGAGALIAAFGMGYGKDTMMWEEEEGDFKNQLAIAVGSIFGVKKSVFNSIDYGLVVLETYVL